MNVKELQLGDYVYNRNKEKRIVCSIGYDIKPHVLLEKFGKEYDCHIEQEYDVIPIPITKEWLEKNFEYRGDNIGIFEDYFDFFISELQDGIWVLLYSSCEFILPDERVHVSYIHELQHVLRHCGIEKELKMED